MSRLDVEALAEGIRSGNRAVLGRAITLVESTREDHRDASQALLEACLPFSGDSVRVGVTGVPGVGKSSFIEALGTRIIEEEGRRLAVLAVDPTSRLSGGSILGDKTRMERLAIDPNAFIRPSPSGTTPGGVARRTREVILLCEAAGYDTVFVETVGVGQAETAVHSMVDFFLLLALAGAGDELQGIKRGILEMADGIAVTKADGENEPAAERARAQFQSALQLFPPTESGWTPHINTCSAMTGSGLEDVWSDVKAYERFARASGYLEARRQEQARHWLRETLDERLLEVLHRDPSVSKTLTELEEKVAKREVGTSAAVDAVLAAFHRSNTAR